ncbi:hypothetical protein B0H14DRAFT_2680869 [Mycena olivaceomarginata]|nr:hypothetical protein B0H14DRAFT_2680869 [Mycena olivaceomarginata]
MTEEYTRADDLWFFDGSLVIKAGQKVFRVYKAQLAARSTVFAAMNASETLQNQGDEFIDGADDVYVFLRAIFDSSYFMPFPEPAFLEDILAILRLSHKYDVGYLHRRALQHLSTEFYSASVEEYLEYEKKTSHLKYRSNDVDKVSYDFAVINAAREVGALWFLPMAYYDACRRGFERLLSALARGPNESHVRTFLSGYHYLCEATLRAALGCLSGPADLCPQPNICKQLHDRWRFIVFEPPTSMPLDLLAQMEKHISPTGLLPHRFCVPCYESVNCKGFRDCWNDLPSYFGLPGWPELNAMKEAAMNAGSS